MNKSNLRLLWLLGVFIYCDFFLPGFRSPPRQSLFKPTFLSEALDLPLLQGWAVKYPMAYKLRIQEKYLQEDPYAVDIHFSWGKLFVASLGDSNALSKAWAEPQIRKLRRRYPALNQYAVRNPDIDKLQEDLLEIAAIEETQEFFTGPTLKILKSLLFSQQAFNKRAKSQELHLPDRLYQFFPRRRFVDAFYQHLARKAAQHHVLGIFPALCEPIPLLPAQISKLTDDHYAWTRFFREEFADLAFKPLDGSSAELLQQITTQTAKAHYDYSMRVKKTKGWKPFAIVVRDYARNVSDRILKTEA